MKAVIQRVSSASVTIGGVETARIGVGLCVLLGVMAGDTPRDAEVLAKKILQMRIFSDEQGKMNHSLQDILGELLVVSNFTLGADCRKGNRPSFTLSEKPEPAQALYRHFLDCCEAACPGQVRSGEFGADMKIALTNDGPVTILLNTDEWPPKG